MNDHQGASPRTDTTGASAIRDRIVSARAQAGVWLGLLALLPLLAAWSPALNAATVTTDSSDYPPGAPSDHYGQRLWPQ